MSELGQVFTPKKVAQLMTDMLLEGMRSHGVLKILDPCIGRNVFPVSLVGKGLPLNLEGVEIDKGLVNSSTREFFAEENRELHIGNFFDFASHRRAEFDLIIANPPYVRHERLTGVNDKAVIRAQFSDKSYKIPAQSNLYVYFLLKSIDLLKSGGKMVVIVYDAWLYSSYGESLKNILSSLGSVESVIHFQNEAFENADVGATIIEFVKGKPQTGKVRFVSFESASKLRGFAKINWSYKSITELVSEPDEAEFKDCLVPLSSIAEINRGTSALSNKLFIFKEKTFQETIPFIKSIKDISSMSALKDKHLLVVNNSFAQETSTYLEKIKQVILRNNQEYQTLAKRIEKGELWYSPRLTKPGDVIFNYYLRDSFDFILNQRRLQSSDNFYNLRFKSNVLAHFALLNSNRVKNSILRGSRRQGNGLRKIQLYEFKKVLVPNLSMFSPEAIASLERLGDQLSRQKRNSASKGRIIENIDKIVEKTFDSREELQKIVYSNIKYDTALVR